MKKDSKVRLFEVLQRVDPIFNQKLNEEMNYSHEPEMLKSQSKEKIFTVKYTFESSPLSYLENPTVQDIKAFDFNDAKTKFKEYALKRWGKEPIIVGVEENKHSDLYTNVKLTEPNEEVLNETTSYSPIHKYVMFGYNYPPDFIEQAWADRPDMAKHFREKFMGYYDKYGAEGVMNAFYVNLDDSNQQILERWIINNYTV